MAPVMIIAAVLNTFNFLTDFHYLVLSYMSPTSRCGLTNSLWLYCNERMSWEHIN